MAFSLQPSPPLISCSKNHFFRQKNQSLKSLNKQRVTIEYQLKQKKNQ
nr:Hypothetical protein [Providencia rettgeri]